MNENGQQQQQQQSNDQKFFCECNSRPENIDSLDRIMIIPSLIIYGISSERIKL